MYVKLFQNCRNNRNVRPKAGNGGVFPLLVCFLLCAAGAAFAQNYSPQSAAGGNFAASAASPFAHRLQRGVGLYRESRWREAIAELRLAREQAENPRQTSEALYWIALAELSASDYEAALKDMDALEYSGGERVVDIAYHRGRAYYYLGFYDEAIALLYDYAAKAGSGERARVSAAYYWIGECLLSLGQIERAKDFFNAITEQYPESAKYEAASYRIALINQKKVEAELLEMIKWSHEESLKSIEENKRRERTYDQALNAYQKQIAEYQRDTRLSDLENLNLEYQRQLNLANERILSLESILESRSGSRLQPGAQQTSSAGDEERLAWALQLRRELEQNMRKMENSGGGTP
jgi:tetratricopeptide (TPR) repeat protein